MAERIWQEMDGSGLFYAAPAVPLLLVTWIFEKRPSMGTAH